MLNKGAQTLPNKDIHDFKSLAKFHDTKNYKKGLKVAEKILQKNSDHPQTLAMKALFQSGLGDDNKALQTAKIALMKSKMQSLLCWHTFGTLHKNKKDYVEAAKSFQNALRLDPDNMQLLRQTASLYIQIRDHTNHVATRYTILKQKPNMINNWASFVLAYHLKGDFPQLFKALGSLDNLIKGIDIKPQELSQYYLYRVLAFKDAGNFEGMYQQLNKNKAQVLDTIIWNEYMVDCCEKLGKKQKIIEHMKILIKQFPQNVQYLKRYQQFSQIKGRQFYKQIQQQFKSKIARILEVNHIHQQQQFKKQFSLFIKPYFKKNLISLYRQIQVIYSSQDHQKWIGEIFQQFEKYLKQGTYPDKQQILSPSEYLWAMYLLAQHYSIKFQNLQKAHEFVCKAIQHTNTVSQIYLVKGQIQYKLHNNFEALKTINQARKTDLADRYMNNICVKYLMKCERPDLAEDVLRLFMKDQANLYQLQNQWYIIQAGKAFLKSRKFGPGLRHLNFIDKQFKQMYGNQYDFHIYCIRKWTLREYVELIAFNDNIYQDKKYIQAAGLAMSYLTQYDHYIKNAKKIQQPEQKKQQQKKSKNKKKKKAIVQVQQLKPIQVFRKKIDYDGKQYLQKINEDPMKQAYLYATNVISVLYKNKGNEKQNQFYFKAFSECINIFIHYKKPLLVIKALKKLMRTGYQTQQIHFYTLKALKYLLSCQNDSKDELIKQIITQYLKQLNYLSKDLKQYHEQVIKTWRKTQFLPLKLKQCQCILNGKDERSSYINLYRQQLFKYRKIDNHTSYQIEVIFYLVHKLQYYGEFTEDQKNDLNNKLGKKTTYFSNWNKDVDALPPSTWSLWWLSEYDQQRQQLDFVEKQKQKTQSSSTAQNSNNQPK